MRNLILLLMLAIGPLTVASCCKKHKKKVYYLTEQDKQLMPYSAGDNIVLQDSATGEVFTFVVKDKVFEERTEAGGLPIGCVNCPDVCDKIDQRAEVGEVIYSNSENRFEIYRRGEGNSLGISFRMVFQAYDTLEFNSYFRYDDEILFYEKIRLNNVQYKDVYRIGSKTVNAYLYIYAQKNQGLISIQDKFTPQSTPMAYYPEN